MKYRHIVTGEELIVYSKISSPKYVPVDEAEPEKKDEVKESPKRKRSAKK